MVKFFKMLVSLVALFVFVLLWTMQIYSASASAPNSNSTCKKGKKVCEALVKKTVAVSASVRAAYVARLAAAKKAREDYIKADQQLAIAQGQDPFIYGAAFRSLGSRKGTILITDVKTQKVEASVFQDVANLREFHPCSTVKIPTALAGINEGVIDGNGKIVGTTKKGLIDLSLDDAIRYSNNYYFNEVGAKVGGPDFLSVLKKTGYGSRTHFNVPGQSTGRIPAAVTSPIEYSHAYNIRVTALQLNELAIGIANSRTQDAFGIPKENLQRLIPGMIKAAEDGTAKLSKSKEYDLKLAGKTGTCQSTGLFTGFVPHDNPKYAITVILQGSGGKFAAKVAGLVLKVMKDNHLLDSPAEVTAD